MVERTGVTHYEWRGDKMTEAQKELVCIWMSQYFGYCPTYGECERLAKGLLEVIEDGERIKECLGDKK